MADTRKYSDFTMKTLFQMILRRIERSETEIRETEKKRPTHLKILFLKDDSRTLTPLNLFDRILEVSSSNRWISNLVEKWALIGHETAERNLYVLEVVEKAYNRTGEFFVVLEDGLWLVYTVEDYHTVKQTMDRIVKHLPELNTIWFPPPELEKITRDIFSGAGFGGFTSKYRPVLYDKKVTIRIFGGDESDLIKARTHFQAEPTRIRFESRGSAAVVIGSLSPGRLTVGSVLSGYEDRLFDIMESVKKNFLSRESANFGKVNGYENRVFRDEEGAIISIAPSVFSAITLTVDKPMRKKKDITPERLVERLKATFLGNEKRYVGYEWDHGNLEVVDLVTGEPFQVTFEDWQFIIYPKEETHAATVREACQQITKCVVPSCTLSVLCEELP